MAAAGGSRSNGEPKANIPALPLSRTANRGTGVARRVSVLKAATRVMVETEQALGRACQC